jgi:hypothetical protein
LALLKILGVLALALAVLLPVLQRVGKPLEAGRRQALSRWLMILMAVLALLGAARHLQWF